MVEACAQRRPRSTWSPISLFLIALMAFGSVIMWIGVPVGLIYLASRLADSPTPSMGPYLLILVGLPVGMVLVGKVLGALDRYHGRITGLDDGEPQQAAWMRSMRGEREPQRAARARHRDDRCRWGWRWCSARCGSSGSPGLRCLARYRTSTAAG